MALIPVSEAQARLLSGVKPVEAERVPIEAADGRVLAEDLGALRTQPPFPASAMDGYAVRAADLVPGHPLRLIGTAVAGCGYPGPLGAGEAVRIFTGAPVPDGADTILIQENAEARADAVTPLQVETPGRYVRPKGLDFTEGEVLLSAGTRLDGRRVALAAAMNHAHVVVRRRPRVALIATGSELVRPGAPAGPDQIVASNALGLAADLRALGAEAIDLGIAPDDLDTIRARIRDAAQAAGADVICLLGGASVGDHDLTRPALEAEGMTLDFWKIAMRPGKPLVVGRLGSAVALGLPGNPVSTLVCGLLFLRPLVRALLGEPDVLPKEEPAVAGAPLPANDRRQDYVRARLENCDALPRAVPLDIQDSSMLSRLAAADALIIRMPGAAALAPGEPCTIIRLD